MKFNLSKKMIASMNYKYFMFEDVKEFIKINLQDLKEVNDTGHGIIGFIERFKKRAGKKLT